MKNTKKKIFSLIAIIITTIACCPWGIFANQANMNPLFDTWIPIGFNGSVNNIVTDNNGKIIIVGDFTTYQGVAANHIIRINADGSRDTSFNIGEWFNGPNWIVSISSLKIQTDGKIVVGGYFSTYQWETANKIIRINTDGSRDTEFVMGTSFVGSVYGIAVQSDNKIIVWGDFSSYQGTAVSKLVRLNTDWSIDTSFDIGTGFDNTIIAIAIQEDNKIVVGGYFSSYQWETANGIIRLNTWWSIDTGFVTAAGFSNDGWMMPFAVINKIEILKDRKMLVNGEFTTYQWNRANSVIKINTDWSQDTSFDTEDGFNSSVYAVATQNDGKIIIWWDFTSYQGSEANKIIRLNADGSRDTNFNIWDGCDHSVNALAIQSDGKIIAGGQFTKYQWIGTNYITRINTNGSKDEGFYIWNWLDNTVYALATQSDGKIIVWGNFITYKWTPAKSIIRLNTDGSRDTSFDIEDWFDNAIYAIEIQDDGKIIVWWDFTSYQGSTANYIIRLNVDGSRDTSFDIGEGLYNQRGWYGTVYDIVINWSGKIFLGWAFTAYQGTSAGRIISLNGDWSRNIDFNIGTGFNGLVQTLEIQNDNKIIAWGTFTSYSGSTANRIIRLNSDGSQDDSFDIGNGFDHYVYTTQIQDDGKILVWGQFSSYQWVSANEIIRLNADGSRDTEFVIEDGFDGYTGNTHVKTIALQNNGKILVGGDFWTYQGNSTNYIARLNTNGSIDTWFDIWSWFNHYVYTLTTQSSWWIMVWGLFTSYKWVAPHLISLYGNNDVVIVPDTTDTTAVVNEFTDKGYVTTNGDLVGITPISLELTNGNIPVNLSLKHNDIRMYIPENIQFKKSDNESNYNGIINVPVPLSISSLYDEPVLSAFKAGSTSESLKLNGGVAIISTDIPEAHIGNTVNIYYSEDNGVSWYLQTTGTIRNVNGQPHLSFETNHFTDFAVTLPSYTLTGSFVINNDIATTSFPNTILTLSTIPTASNMRFSNNGSTWSSRETYNTTKSRKLSDEHGTKTVYVQFDADGDKIQDAETSDTIEYLENPVQLFSPSSWTTLTTGTTSFIRETASDTGTAISWYFITISGTNITTGYITTTGTTVSWLSNGNYSRSVYATNTDWSTWMLSNTRYFSVNIPTTQTNNNIGNWGGWTILQKDICNPANRDCSDSYYDKLCWKCPSTSTWETGITTTTGNSLNNAWNITNSIFSNEFNNAYLFAYKYTITTMPTIQKANMGNNLIRAHMAKMLVNYAVKIFGLQPNTWNNCIFTDIADQSPEMKAYIKLYCQLWLTQATNKFYPNEIVTRDQFGTALSKIIWWSTYNTKWTEYYLGHFKALKKYDIIKNTNPKFKEIRGYAMIMLMRAAELFSTKDKG